jgi:hypothetical protein
MPKIMVVIAVIIAGMCMGCASTIDKELVIVQICSVKSPASSIGVSIYTDDEGIASQSFSDNGDRRIFSEWKYRSVTGQHVASIHKLIHSGRLPDVVRVKDAEAGDLIWKIKEKEMMNHQWTEWLQPSGILIDKGDGLNIANNNNAKSLISSKGSNSVLIRLKLLDADAKPEKETIPGCK